MPRPLADLTPGERFQTADTERKGTLLYLSPSSAMVEWDGSREQRRGKTKWGEEFAFRGGKRQEAVSLGTPVRRLVQRKVTKKKRRGK